MHVFPNDAALTALCRRYRIRRLSLFGSTLKGTNRPDSDVDLLVEFEPDAKPGLLTMAEIEIELSPLLGGRKVDLRTAQDLSRYFRDEVVRYGGGPICVSLTRRAFATCLMPRTRSGGCSMDGGGKISTGTRPSHLRSPAWWKFSARPPHEVSAEQRAATPHIRWPAIVGMRNRLVHAYFDIDHDIVWKAATEEIPALLPALRALLPKD